jgi:hypothetical protein
VGVLLIAIYVLLPWIPINGSPAVFLDVENRMFHLFGLTLVPQDLWVMFFAVSGLGFALFFITSLLGASGAAGPAPTPCSSTMCTAASNAGSRATPRPPRAWTGQRRGPPGKSFKRLTQARALSGVAALIAHVFLSYFVSLNGFTVSCMTRSAGTCHRLRHRHLPHPGAVVLLRLLPRAILHHHVPLRPPAERTHRRRHDQRRLR